MFICHGNIPARLTKYSGKRSLTSLALRIVRLHVAQLTLFQFRVMYISSSCFALDYIKHTYFLAWGSVVVKALRYKAEGPGIDSRCRRGFFRGI
jgi:hypothetical protein